MFDIILFFEIVAYCFYFHGRYDIAPVLRSRWTVNFLFAHSMTRLSALNFELDASVTFVKPQFSNNCFFKFDYVGIYVHKDC